MTYLNHEQIGRRVRQLREEAAERQVDIAAVLGLDQTAMSRIESGARAITARELVLLSQHYGVATATFLEPERELTPLRQGEAVDEKVDAALRLFHGNIDSYFGARALARG